MNDYFNAIANKFQDFKKDINKHHYIQITDTAEILIDGCKGIESYTENLIRVQLYNRTATITGLNLVTANFIDEGLIIKGDIFSIQFSE